MKKHKFFLAFPFSMFCDDDTDTLTDESKDFFKNLTEYFKENGLDYYSAHERENWGETYHSEEESTRFDYEAIKKCDVMLCVPGNPYSGGTHIELGWASCLKKKIILFLEKGVYYSPLVTGISCMTDVSIYYYSDFFKDILPIIRKIVDEQIENNCLQLINDFLNKRKEKIINIKRGTGGNHNKLFIVNEKYFIKFKDELSVIEEREFFKKDKINSPKLYYSNIKNKMLVYENLDAIDLEDGSMFKDLIDIVFNYSKESKYTRKNSYGYLGMENDSWIGFLKQEVDVSKDFLKDYISKDNFIIVDNALNEIDKYSFRKRILHGDFGLHNTMITKDKKIYFIDPEVVIGDWIYDFIFYCFSDISVMKMITFDEIINKINENKNKVRAMMIIVMFNRLRRVLKYSKEDFKEYYKSWKQLGGLND